MTRRAALIACGIVIGTAIVYGGAIVRQAGPEGPLADLNPNVVIVLAAIMTLAVLTGYGWRGSAPERRSMALWAALPGLIVLGVLGGFSIGILFLTAAVPTLIAGLASLSEASIRRGLVLGTLAAATLAWAGVGFLLLQLASLP